MKRVFVALFTNNPYKIRRFCSIFYSVGKPVDQAETLSGVIISEPGEPFLYGVPFFLNQEKVSHRVLERQNRFIASGVFKEPERNVYSVSKGGILGQIGLVYEPRKRCFIDESANEWLTSLRQSVYVSAINLPAKTLLKGITFSFLTIGADGGFYHFLFESIVKAGIYGSLLASSDHLLFNGPQLAWKIKWIEKAGIDASRIIWVDSTSHYQCEQLLFTNRLVADQQINKWAINTLNKIFGVGVGSDNIAPKKIVWLSRKGNVARNLAWEDELLTHFPNIDRLDLTTLSVDDTMLCFQTATHVIGPHGAGFSNLFLCKAGTKVLEIFPEEAFFQPCYSRLSDLCKLVHQIVYLNFQNQEGPYGLDFLSQIITEFLC